MIETSVGRSSVTGRKMERIVDVGINGSQDEQTRKIVIQLVIINVTELVIICRRTEKAVCHLFPDLSGRPKLTFPTLLSKNSDKRPVNAVAENN